WRQGYARCPDHGHGQGREPGARRLRRQQDHRGHVDPPASHLGQVAGDDGRSGAVVPALLLEPARGRGQGRRPGALPARLREPLMTLDEEIIRRVRLAPNPPPPALLDSLEAQLMRALDPAFTAREVFGAVEGLDLAPREEAPEFAPKSGDHWKREIHTRTHGI